MANDFILWWKDDAKWFIKISGYNRFAKNELEEYNNNPLVDTIKTLVNKNNGKWAGSLKELGIEQQKLYSNLIDNKVKNSMIEPIKPLLKKYDGIDYYITPNPVKNDTTGKSERQKVFYKVPIKKDVENVESVDNVVYTKWYNNYIFYKKYTNERIWWKMTDFVENFKKLNDKQQTALSLLLIGDNNKVVASKVGVDENTIYRWRTDPIFKELLINLRIQALQSIEIKLHTRQCREWKQSIKSIYFYIR